MKNLTVVLILAVAMAFTGCENKTQPARTVEKAETANPEPPHEISIASLESHIFRLGKMNGEYCIAAIPLGSTQDTLAKCGFIQDKKPVTLSRKDSYLSIGSSDTANLKTVGVKIRTYLCPTKKFETKNGMLEIVEDSVTKKIGMGRIVSVKYTSNGIVVGYVDLNDIEEIL